MVAKKVDKSFAKVLTHDTIGLSGVSAVWMLGKPFHRGQTSEHAREIARGSYRLIRKTLRLLVS